MISYHRFAKIENRLLMIKFSEQHCVAMKTLKVKRYYLLAKKSTVIKRTRLIENDEQADFKVLGISIVLRTDSGNGKFDADLKYHY
jgi:hypothetical protein